MKINIFIREEKIIFTKEEDSMGNVICRMSGACLSMIPKDFYKTLSELIEKKEPMILDLTKMKNFGPEFSGDILNLYRLSRKEEMKFILIGGDLNNLLNWNGLNFINHDSLI
jgi:hypothetical protein